MPLTLSSARAPARAPAAPPARGRPAPFPETVAPMLAVLSAGLPPDGRSYSFEYKWDGVRAVCFWDGRSVRLSSRNHLDMTVQYPELQAIGPALGARTAV